MTRLLAVLFFLLTAFDLFTKSVAVKALADGIHIDLIKGVLEFYYIQNRGAAFGIFQDGTLILGGGELVRLLAGLFRSCRCGGGESAAAAAAPADYLNELLRHEPRVVLCAHGLALQLGLVVQHHDVFQHRCRREHVLA